MLQSRKSFYHLFLLKYKLFLINVQSCLENEINAAGEGRIFFKKNNKLTLVVRDKN